MGGVPFREVFLHADWNQALLLRRAFAQGRIKLYGNPYGPECRITVHRAKHKIDVALDFPASLSDLSWERIGRAVRHPEKLARIRAVFKQLKGNAYSFSVRLDAKQFAALAEASRLADLLDRMDTRIFNETEFRTMLKVGA